MSHYWKQDDPDAREGLAPSTDEKNQSVLCLLIPLCIRNQCNRTKTLKSLQNRAQRFYNHGVEEARKHKPSQSQSHSCKNRHRKQCPVNYSEVAESPPISSPKTTCQPLPSPQP